MSALGQKQTYALQQAMSALPPKATSIAAHGVSAKGQKLKGSCRANHVRFALKCRHGRRSICASALCQERKSRPHTITQRATGAVRHIAPNYLLRCSCPGRCHRLT